MTQRSISFIEGEYYHIYNRGNSKQNIFIDDEDKERFVKLLYLCNSGRSINFRDDIIKQEIDAWDFDRGKAVVSIGAWVLMPNHFHIYLTFQRVDLGLDKGRPFGNFDNPISLFMNKLGTAYSMYFNTKHKRVGGLFEGKFKSVHIGNDSQAKYLFSYIHLNPIKLIYPKWKEDGIVNYKKAISFLGSYPWSSYHDYKDKNRKERKIIYPKDFPDYFSDPKVFDAEIFDWLTFDSDDDS